MQHLFTSQMVLSLAFDFKYARYIIPILLGALIGYVTNWLAVKMLFRPRKQLKIGKWRVPFTPGVIPKRKPEIARTIGRAVADTLITQEDLQKVLLSDSVKRSVADGVTNTVLSQTQSVRSQIKMYLGADKEEAFFNTLSEKISEVLAQGVGRIELSDLLAQRGAELADKHFSGMLSMFLGKEKIASIAKSFGDGIVAYMQEHGTEFLQPHVAQELDRFLQKDSRSLVAFCGLSEDALYQLVYAAYEALIREKSYVLISQIHLDEIVEEKINSMDSEALEKLTLYVLKKELNAVVNFGAILGALIGVLNVFFY